DLKTSDIYSETYDNIILSPGANPVKPPIPGVDSNRVFTVRNIPDIDAIMNFINQNNPRHAVVVGGGFIGLEMVENLKHRGIDVTVVEMLNQVFKNIDYDMACIIHNHLMSKGINLQLNDGVRAFEDKGDRIDVILNSQKTIQADMVVMSIGVRPDIQLAQEAGLKIGKLGGIEVNEYMQTSDPDIYAVGDAVEKQDIVTDSYCLVPLAGPANRQGRIAANNIMGKEDKYNGVQGTSIIKVFDITVAQTGSNQEILKQGGKKYLSIFCEANSHAGYYPGASPLTIKLLFSPTGKILGAQIVGCDGVDKRIDVLASAIRFEKTVFDLQELELAYAPPYSSAKDPVNMAGYIASNVINGEVDVVQWNQVEDVDRDETVLLDVRKQYERENGFIEGAINIPLDEIRQRLDDIPRDKDIIVYCKTGLRSYIACKILQNNGFENVKNLTGGIDVYKNVKQAEERLRLQQ
ncbi:MAG: FAD-dependent oxidoreductase, partial [Clostridia bacterium]|nr:FAD-dependent oxidoreductase [Clostridia bacterium]